MGGRTLPFEKDLSRTRNPFEIYLLLLAIVTSAPSMLGVAPTPSSIEFQLGIYARVWSFFLFAGCAVALVGIFWPRPRHQERYSVTGLGLEQTGLVSVAGATIYYSVAIIAVIGSTGLITAGIVLAFGLASGVQALRIHRWMKKLRPANED